MRKVLFGLAMGLSVLAAAAAAGTVVISEVLYDAAGSDDGKGFVELYGPGGTSLSGYTLTALNGADGGTTHSIDLGSFSLPPDGVFVVADEASGGGTSVANADLLVANLDFQNGPDSVALLSGGVFVDAVGYGTFGAGTVFTGEGDPAPDPAAGASIARRFADVDVNDNALDFVVLDEPTPGVVKLSGVATVPEPATGVLAGLGLLCLALRARRQSRKAKTSPASVTT